MSRRFQHSLTLVDSLVMLCVAVLIGSIVYGLVAPNLLMVAAGGGLLGFIIVWVGTINLLPENTRAQATERTLRMANNTLKHLRGGLTVENAQALCRLLLHETEADAIAITNTTHILAFEGILVPAAGAGDPNTAPTLEVIESKHMETFVSLDHEFTHVKRFVRGLNQRGSSYGIIVPLLVQDKVVGTIKIYYRRDFDIDKIHLRIAQGLGQILSTQLSYYELDQQAELTTRAEVKALQAQINPHFLFNALNTIASLTRTNPTKARNLLREFSQFYRRTLENSEQPLIPLSEELEQTRRYLTIERARFGEDRIVEEEHIEAGLESLPVPSFMIQPIVENAIRHAMRDSGPLRVDIHVVSEDDDILIAVADDGMGMEQEAADRLLSSSHEILVTHRRGSRGTGMALKNVQERIERFFDERAGIEILSKPGEGTCVTLRLAGAAKQFAEQNAIRV